ncbi:MAG: glycosyltransferase family 2 protein, partial [Actinobacteria bacterium]|nr:glycosyltransferase family 2 protein [Actinomycetota bacterium]
HLAAAVKAILAQDYQGRFEVILAVGPSKDQTLEIANQLAKSDSRVVVVLNPTGRTAAGLNIALAKSNSPIIVRVDGHAEIPSNYLSIAVELLRETGAVNVGGLMGAVGKTRFEKSVARAMRSPLGVGAAKFHTGGGSGEVDTVYLGCFLREALIEIGGFDERFTRAQDWELNFRLRKRGGKIYFDPRLEVTYRPRPNLAALAKQYFEYGRWRRVVSRKHSGTINYRYLAPPLALTGTVLSLIAGATLSKSLFIPAIIYVGFTVIAGLALGKGWLEKMIMPAVLFTMQMAWGAGFITSPKSLVPQD